MKLIKRFAGWIKKLLQPSSIFALCNQYLLTLLKALNLFNAISILLVSDKYTIRGRVGCLATNEEETFKANFFLSCQCKSKKK